MAPVLSECTGVEVEKVTPKSAKSHRSQVTQAKARSSASVLERETTVFFLVFQAIKEEPRKTQ